MQDENQVQPNEVEEQETVEVSPVEELVNQITDGELNKAETSFQSIVQDKIVDALDVRVSVGGAIYNDNEEVEISDEEVEEEMRDHDEVEYEEDKEEEKSEEDAS